ncbi:hypothetical protein [Guyparkeria sp.]|uniref:hypothetical protein n=1 Tax=Guyparkeria sp. TaxID=2035736 RepID=UPI003970C19C
MTMRRLVTAHRSLALGATLLLGLLAGCESTPPDHPFLPWDVEVNEQGQVSVFGVTLEESTLLDFKRRYDQKADLSIFAKPGEPLTLEAFFGRMNVGPLTATVVLVADVDQDTLKRWADESSISDPTPSGARKLSMSDEALVEAQEMPIRSISYVPTADFEEELIARRFGKPAEKLAIPRGERDRDEPSAMLWLYPEKGLAITVEEDDKELFQYINPANFDQLVERTLGEVPEGDPERH